MLLQAVQLEHQLHFPSKGEQHASTDAHSTLHVQHSFLFFFYFTVYDDR
jgi:hypothetical protein